MELCVKTYAETAILLRLLKIQQVMEGCHSSEAVDPMSSSFCVLIALTSSDSGEGSESASWKRGVYEMPMRFYFLGEKAVYGAIFISDIYKADSRTGPHLLWLPDSSPSGYIRVEWPYIRNNGTILEIRM